MPATALVGGKEEVDVKSVMLFNNDHTKVMAIADIPDSAPQEPDVIFWRENTFIREVDGDNYREAVTFYAS